MIWHYTTLPNLGLICKDNCIKPSKYWAPRIWFSANHRWEESGTGWNGNDRKTFEEMASLGIGRIGVDEIVAPISWNEFKLSLNQQFVQELESHSRYGAKPSDWYLSPGPVFHKVWRAVQVFEDGAWRDVKTWSPIST